MGVRTGMWGSKPLLGDPIHPITAARIHGALQLTRYCFDLARSGVLQRAAFIAWLSINLPGGVVIIKTKSS